MRSASAFGHVTEVPQEITILTTKFSFRESIKLRALRAKNVLTCHCALRAYVLTCQRALRAYVLTCQRALRAYVPTCQPASFDVTIFIFPAVVAEFVDTVGKVY